MAVKFEATFGKSGRNVFQEGLSKVRYYKRNNYKFLLIDG
jgi:hypothetical protein